MAPLLQFLCGLRGHQEYLHFGDNRIYLECAECGYESPGWVIERRSVARRPDKREAKPSLQSLERKVA